MARFERYAQGTPSYVELMTPDQGAAKDFYGALFGWELEDTPPDVDGRHYVAVAKDGDVIAGISAMLTDKLGHPAWWGVYLTVEDVDAATAAVTGAGGKVDGGPMDVEGMGRMSMIQDPTGARVNLWQAGGAIGTIRANEPGTPIWHELLTPDVATATRFYSDVLGVGWEDQPMEGGPPYTCLVVDGRPVGGAMSLDMEGVPPYWAVYFNVEDADATIARATELGGSVVAPAFDVPGVGRMAVLADPQGGYFNLMQNPD